MKELNANETIVWKALIKASDFQGHDFGFTDDVWRDDVTAFGDLLDPKQISKAQFSGYVSQLQSKGYIYCIDEPEWENGFYLTQAGAVAAGVEYYADNHPDRA